MRAYICTHTHTHTSIDIITSLETVWIMNENNLQLRVIISKQVSVIVVYKKFKPFERKLNSKKHNQPFERKSKFKI